MRLQAAGLELPAPLFEFFVALAADAPLDPGLLLLESVKVPGLELDQVLNGSLSPEIQRPVGNVSRRIGVAMLLQDSPSVVDQFGQPVLWIGVSPQDGADVLLARTETASVSCLGRHWHVFGAWRFAFDVVQGRWKLHYNAEAWIVG